MGTVRVPVNEPPAESCSGWRVPVEGRDRVVAGTGDANEHRVADAGGAARARQGDRRPPGPVLGSIVKRAKLATVNSAHRAVDDVAGKARGTMPGRPRTRARRPSGCVPAESPPARGRSRRLLDDLLRRSVPPRPRRSPSPGRDRRVTLTSTNAPGATVNGSTTLSTAAAGVAASARERDHPGTECRLEAPHVSTVRPRASADESAPPGTSS